MPAEPDDAPTRAVHLGADLQRRLARSALSVLDVGPGYLRRVQDDWGHYARDVAGLTIDYYRGLADAARVYGERVAAAGGLDGVHDEAGVDGRPGEVTAAGRPRLELRGPSGSVLVASFTLENRDPEPAHVTVSAGPARSDDGEPFVAPLSLEPASLTIPPDGTRQVDVRLPLLPEVFEPGTAYALPVHVTGPRPVTIEVAVVSEPSVTPPPDADSA